MWVLICITLAFTSNGVGLDHRHYSIAMQEFTTKDSCEVAAKYIRKNMGGNFPDVICVEK